ncbi:uncharacterized protein [Equus caballus]|uniref:uncharacterized protein isoform X2 n=1 Tax=Equus caballus TaxID=9796 RepID=UPI0038B3CB00
MNTRESTAHIASQLAQVAALSIGCQIAAWLDNSLVRIAQTITNATQAVDCWICLPRAQSTLDHGDLLVHPVSDFAQVPDGDWVPTRDLRALTFMYQFARKAAVSRISRSGGFPDLNSSLLAL